MLPQKMFLFLLAFAFFNFKEKDWILIVSNFQTIVLVEGANTPRLEVGREGETWEGMSFHYGVMRGSGLALVLTLLKCIKPLEQNSPN